MRRPRRGFTLVEVLVALGVMAVMAVMAWRSIDQLLRAQESSASHHHQASTVHLALLQWQTDLDAIGPQAGVKTLEFDGSSLRLLRADASEAAALRVVAWRVREGQWWRWQSPPLRLATEVKDAWAWAQAWGQGQVRSAQASVLLAADDWTIHYFRDNAWSNPLSASGAPLGNLPNGVRLRLHLSAGGVFSGWLQSDWAAPLWTPTT